MFNSVNINLDKWNKQEAEKIDLIVLNKNTPNEILNHLKAEGLKVMKHVSLDGFINPVLCYPLYIYKNEVSAIMSYYNLAEYIQTLIEM